MISFCSNLSLFIEQELTQEFEDYIDVVAVNISDINDHSVGEASQYKYLKSISQDSDKLELVSFLKCLQDADCEIIQRRFNDDGLLFKNDFETSIAQQLTVYLSMNVTFKVESLSNVTALHSSKKSQKPRDYAFYGIMAVAGLIAFVGVVALVFNEGFIPAVGPCNIADNARWTAFIIIGLQIYDFGLLPALLSK